MRRLTPHERAIWHRVTQSVRPLPGRAPPVPIAPPPPPPPEPAPVVATKPVVRPAPAPAAKAAKPTPPPAAATLDGGWDRRLSRGAVLPDRVIDLHNHSLDGAYQRLSDTLHMAAATGERVILVVTGKGRHDRPGRIRGELAHWLEQPGLRARVAALRPAHQRHGGAGAFYIILKRPAR